MPDTLKARLKTPDLYVIYDETGTFLHVLADEHKAKKAGEAYITVDGIENRVYRMTVTSRGSQYTLIARHIFKGES